MGIPNAKLHIQGDVVINNTSPLLKLEPTGHSDYRAKIRARWHSDYAFQITVHDHNVIRAGCDASEVYIGQHAQLVTVTDEYGDWVGIGTAAPAEKLVVAGNVKVDGSYLDSSADAGTSGQILSSTGTGTDWVNPSSVSDGDWTVSGSDMYSAVTGNVGIGDSTPDGKFAVNPDGIEGSDDEFVVDSLGYVGMGTTSPSERLEVKGNININSVYKIGGDTVLSTEGPGNTFLGRLAGQSNTGGGVNTFLGEAAGNSNTTGEQNTFVGFAAGWGSTDGEHNTFLGYTAGFSNETGAWNTFVGTEAGHDCVDGNSNTFLGHDAGFSNVAGSDNTLVGVSAGRSRTYGYDNTIVGCRAGFNATTGSRNVFIGKEAGYFETGSDKLYIANGQSNNNVLIYGDFLTRRVGIAKTSADEALDVSGSIQIGGLLGDGIRFSGYDQKNLIVTGWDADDFLDVVSFYTPGNKNLSELMRLRSDGRLGIGTTEPAYDLDVNGDIRAIGSVYYGGSEGNADGDAYDKPDYVFEEGYDVMSIEQVEQYLKKENHLPWMTSARDEKEEHGGAIDMTRMAFETVETAENLQVQVVELNKRIKVLEAENKDMKSRLASIESMLAKSGQ